MAVIHVVGLGPGDMNGLPMGTFQILRGHETVILRTRIHPVVPQLEAQGHLFESFDDIYEESDSFEVAYRAMADRLLKRAAAGEDIVYAVPGHPLVAEQSVQYLLDADCPNVEVRVGPGQSFLDIACSRLKIDPIDGLLLLDGTTLQGRALNPNVHTLIAQVYQAPIAADVKLTLMELYPDDFPVTVLRAAGVEAEERIEEVPLFELDRLDFIDHLTTVYVPPVKDRAQRVRDPWEAVDIVAALRGPGGCPWDREQTHATLRKYVIEEAYEVAAAIDEQDYDHLADELGDLLLQVLLHAQIGEEFGEFTMRDVFANLADKLVRRHPHVFGEADAENVAQANAVWDRVKETEASQTGDEPRGVLAKVNLAGPALSVATEVQKAAAKVGFDWNQAKDVLDKVKEEMNELEAELERQPAGPMFGEELGDVLFSVVNLARWTKFDSEQLLMQATRKFIGRFHLVEQAVEASGRGWSNFEPTELDELWKQAKIELKRRN